MFDLGWAEMAVIMLVALIVIGPKDLPKVARTIGQWTGKARALARDFQRSLDDMAREAELDEIKKTINRASGTSMRQAVKDFIDPDDELERAFDVEDEDHKRPAKQSSNVRKPVAPPKALTAGAEPTLQPPAVGGDKPAAVSIDKAPAQAPVDATPAAADQGTTSRG